MSHAPNEATPSPAACPYPIEQQRQIVQDHLQSAAAIFDMTLATLARLDRDLWNAAQRALSAGAMLSTRCTAARSGLLHLSVDLILPNGEAQSLVDMDLAQDGPPIGH